MPTEKKPRDPRIQVWDNSPTLLGHEPKPDVIGGVHNLSLRLDELEPGKSLVIPLDLAHEPSLRVRVSRENGKVSGTGKIYRMVKHGHPYWCYEIGCMADTSRIVGSNAPVPRETQTEPEAEPPMTFDPSRLPPLDELGREIES